MTSLNLLVKGIKFAMYIKVYYKGDKDLDVIGNITAVKVLLNKGILLAYRGSEYRSLFLGDIKEIILKED